MTSNNSDSTIKEAIDTVRAAGGTVSVYAVTLQQQVKQKKLSYQKAIDSLVQYYCNNDLEK